MIVTRENIFKRVFFWLVPSSPERKISFRSSDKGDRIQREVITVSVVGFMRLVCCFIAVLGQLRFVSWLSYLGRSTISAAPMISIPENK